MAGDLLNSFARGEVATEGAALERGTVAVGGTVAEAGARAVAAAVASSLLNGWASS